MCLAVPLLDFATFPVTLMPSPLEWSSALGLTGLSDLVYEVSVR